MPKQKKSTAVTTDDLAVMVKKGFDGVDKQFIETNNKINKKVDGLRVEMNNRFDEIEKLILNDHTRRIERLEIQMKDLKQALLIK